MLTCKFSELRTYSTSVTIATVPKTRYWFAFESVALFIPLLASVFFLLITNISTASFTLCPRLVYNHSNSLSLIQVRALQGIPALVELFSSENRAVQRYATGATRNLIYENAENKVSLVDTGGITRLVSILSEPDEELRKTITGKNGLRKGALTPAVCGDSERSTQSDQITVVLLCFRLAR